MSTWSLTYQQNVIKRCHSIKHFSEFLPTRWRQKSTGIDMEQNYVTVTLLTCPHPSPLNVKYTDSTVWNYVIKLELSIWVVGFEFLELCFYCYNILYIRAVVRAKMLALLSGTLHILLVVSAYCANKWWFVDDSITRSLFHSRLKSFLFCKSSLPQPFLFLLQDSLYGFPRLFTVTTKHIRLFTF